MKRIGLIIALLGCQLYAENVVVHVFPLVVEFKKKQKGIEPEWYLLLGKNAEKDAAFTVDIFQEFGATISVKKQSDVTDKMLWAFAINTYLTGGTNKIYNNSDLSSLIRKQTKESITYFDGPVYRLVGEKDKQGVSHQYIYVLLDARKPLARLNTDGRNEYKTEFKWMLVSDIQKFSVTELKNQNINVHLKTLLNDRWNLVAAHFIKQMCGPKN